MKVLINKIKKVSKIFLIIYLITFITYVMFYSALFKNLIALSSVETAIRFTVLTLFGAWVVIYLVWNLVNLILKRHITIAITTSLTVILMVIFGFVNYYIGMLNNNIENLAEKEYVTYTSNLVVRKSTKINKDSVLGIINNNKDIEGNILAKELIKDKSLDDCEVRNYSSYYEMLYDLLNKEIDGIFLKSNYLTIYSEEEFSGLNDTEILYSYSKEMKNQDTEIKGTKNLTDPFTILLMGVDSEKEGLNASTSFNGDTLMMITFNPETLNATMFSIPRDTYVPIACNHNRYAKINSSAAYGTSCVIDTVEELTGIEIDYYVKINFQGVVQLVDALGGIDVDVQAPDYTPYINSYNGKVCEQNSLRQFGDNLICIDPGMQHLNGEEALAYARCRHAYLLSDIARNKHQQQIIEALAKKGANSSNIGKLDKILEAITNNVDTNMSKSKILSFYDVLKDMVLKTFNDEQFISIEKTYLEYYNLPVRLSNNGLMVSAIGYYPGSLEAIVNLMKANLGLEKKELIKTFSFDANEEYSSKVTGQGITTGDKLITLPNFVGNSVNEAQNWALNHDIEVKIEFVDSSSVYYNPEVAKGLIASQSVSDGVLINNISELTIYINNGDKPHEDKDKDEVEDKDKEIEDNDSYQDEEKDDPLDMVLPSE